MKLINEIFDVWKDNSLLFSLFLIWVLLLIVLGVTVYENSLESFVFAFTIWAVVSSLIVFALAASLIQKQKQRKVDMESLLNTQKNGYAPNELFKGHNDNLPNSDSLISVSNVIIHPDGGISFNYTDGTRGKPFIPKKPIGVRIYDAQCLSTTALANFAAEHHDDIKNLKHRLEQLEMEYREFIHGKDSSNTK